MKWLSRRIDGEVEKTIRLLANPHLEVALTGSARRNAEYNPVHALTRKLNPSILFREFLLHDIERKLGHE